jgi:hypothetical protein
MAYLFIDSLGVQTIGNCQDGTPCSSTAISRALMSVSYKRRRRKLTAEYDL